MDIAHDFFANEQSPDWMQGGNGNDPVEMKKKRTMTRK
jgi:hypothetical protein